MFKTTAAALAITLAAGAAHAAEPVFAAPAPDDNIGVNELAHPHAFDSVLVRFKPAAARNADALVAAVGSVRHTYSLVDGLVAVDLNGRTTVEQALRDLRNNPDVLYAEPDYLWFRQNTPNDTNFSSLWGMNNTGQSGGTPGSDINALAAWDLFTGDPNLVIGVIDGGTDLSHPDLAPNAWTNPGEIPGNGIDDDNNGYVDDVNGWDFFDEDNDPRGGDHGSHVSGTIAAKGNNNLGVTGVVWDAKIMPLRFIGPSSGSTADAIRAIEYANNFDVRVTNNSWGGGGFSQSLFNAINAARANNSLFVAASGNDGAGDASYPARYSLDNVIAVAATDRNDNMAGFSNVNATNVDIAAPGVAVVSTVPASSYASFQGTSMASPHVAGVAALLIGARPDLSYSDVRDAILSTARPVPGFQSLVAAGGVVDAEAALLDVNGPPSIAFVNQPQIVAPGTQSTVTVILDDGAEGYDPSTVEINVSVNNGPFQATPMTNTSGDTFTADLPAALCDDSVRYFISATSLVGTDVFLPRDGIAAPAAILIGEEIELFADNFDTDTGWTVSNSAGLTAGAWERGQPVAFNRGNPTSDADGNNWAFLTDNNPSDENSDVDNGTTTITSSVIDVTGGGSLSYAYWMNDVANGALNGDSFDVELSFNGGSSWTTVTSINSASPSWRTATHNIPSTDSLQIRVTVGDLGTQNVVEGGFDAVAVTRFGCNNPDTGCTGDANGDNSVDALDISVVLGNFGQSTSTGDLDDDGTVTPADISIVLGAFGSNCN